MTGFSNAASNGFVYIMIVGVLVNESVNMSVYIRARFAVFLVGVLWS